MSASLLEHKLSLPTTGDAVNVGGGTRKMMLNNKIRFRFGNSGVWIERSTRVATGTRAGNGLFFCTCW